MHVLYLKLSPEERLALRSYLAWWIYSPWELKHTNMYTHITITDTVYCGRVTLNGKNASWK